ncbi:tRNA/tmRNA/rRNA uracil-C5-methylase (TrmA/RlmC/RlmD family) [Trueperella bonasi]|uniref:tRNA/tmRNA/rRNA uracil-C5-methylase (TrmA/RlmC/RlmD family) n=1 Tax=Trueperella bonasi TaxID=312286 RepID=A0ABT9NIG6_9ACTO|nr:TRAM domain-containing protein [Trueperella bonasi]MDP9807134.1 tRNA/tmRNA/rRNA uracil-C5-methylase (TrmA/RlmC/RlmD family) [Trueperella bonasi]
MKLTIEDIGHGGVGVARYEGQVIFVRGALPGEIVEAVFTSRKSKYSTALVTGVIEPSEFRVDHPWPVGAAGYTGAADFGHVTTQGQLALKTQVIRNTVRRIGGEELFRTIEHLGVEVRAIDSGKGWGTRTRYEVTKLESGVGMFREKSHELVAIEEMPLALPDLAELKLWASAWDSYIKPGTRLKAVAPASGDNVVVAGDVVWSAPGLKATEHIWERASTEDDIYDYRMNAKGFWQVHFRAPSTLLTSVLAGAQVLSGEYVAELFSGAGLFTLPLAQKVGKNGRVDAFEGSQSAVADARYNLRHTPWAHANVAKIDHGIVREIEGADVVIADPPRAGLGRGLAENLGRLSARKIVLVSCDPAAMARDVAQLVASGRKVESMDAIDIFPNTHHVEIVTALS